MATAGRGSRSSIFCYRVRKYIGAYIAAMNGADAIIFAGGIGENSPEVRRRVCDGLDWLGIEVDDSRNNSSSVERGALMRRDRGWSSGSYPHPRGTAHRRRHVGVVTGSDARG